ncbi:MAG: response regulator transcription factor [Actinomycetota bacterium]
MSDERAILMIEDDPDVRLAMTVLFKRAGYRTIEASDGRAGLRALHEHRPDCVILDIGLPDIDGWQVLERIRDLSDVPVMMVTARHLEAEKVRGLQAGADDYLTKPFGNQEVVARVQALLRRSATAAEPAAERAVQSDGVIVIDPATHRVTVDGSLVELTSIEFRVLYALMQSVPRVLSPEHLLEVAWSDPTGIGPDRVKYVVHRLRRKLGYESADESPIEAVRGVGYRFIKAG